MALDAGCMYYGILAFTSVLLILLARYRRTTRSSPVSFPTPKAWDTKESSSGSQLNPSFSNIFPPSTRQGLLRLSAAGKTKHTFLASIDSLEFQRKLIDWQADYRRCDDDTVLPSGIRLSEVKALGDFPDYAVLSDYPKAEEYQGFVLETALERPYRPFRWGYYQTMSLMRLEPDWWLELTSSYLTTISRRLSLIETYGKTILDYLPGSELAAKEAMEISLQYYCQRHPRFFSLTYNSTMGWVFHNSILHNSTIIRDHHPLRVLAMHIPEDFALLLRNPEDGKYYLRGGVICSSIGWNLGEKLGQELSQVHGFVPDYKEKMEFSMDRFFAKLPPSKPIQRGSWGFEIGRPLFVAPDDPQSKANRSVQRPDITETDISLRVDWQTLRRMPLSGGILFNFKALFTPLEELREERYIPRLVFKVLTEGHPGIREYKNTWHTEHVVVPALERWSREQVERGKVEESHPVETLKQSPFYPGWEERWHARQGF